jgi:acyl-CoA thioesterase I
MKPAASSLSALARALLVAALTICASVRPAAAAAQQEVLIEAYGDSTTLGISCIDGHCGARSQNAVTYLQDALQSAYGWRVSVVNYGVGGTMASQLRDGTERGRGTPWKTRLAASRAQIVTINYGINEVMRGQTPEQFYAAESDLVATARSLGKQVVLETSNPMPDGRLNARLAAMASMTRRVAVEQHVLLVDQFAYISALPDWKSMMSDGAHPKPELYRIKAGQDFDVLDPVVRQMLERGKAAEASSQ